MRISDWSSDVCSSDLLDSFIAAAILNRLRGQGWEAHITAPTPKITSMNGVTIERQQPLDFAAKADAVIIGSGIKTREIAADRSEEHTSELQSLMRISYAVFCLKKQINTHEEQKQH